MKPQSQPVANATPAPTPAPQQRKKRKMTAQHRANIQAAANRRKLQLAGGNTGTTTTTGTSGGSGRLTAIETLRSAARGNWSAQQIGQALSEARREVAVLEALEKAAQHAQPERAIGAGQGFNQG